eukprot:g3371.t1
MLAAGCSAAPAVGALVSLASCVQGVSAWGWRRPFYRPYPGYYDDEGFFHPDDPYYHPYYGYGYPYGPRAVYLYMMSVLIIFMLLAVCLIPMCAASSRRRRIEAERRLKERGTGIAEDDGDEGTSDDEMAAGGAARYQVVYAGSECGATERLSAFVESVGEEEENENDAGPQIVEVQSDGDRELL